MGLHETSNKSLAAVRFSLNNLVLGVYHEHILPIYFVLPAASAYLVVSPYHTFSPLNSMRILPLLYAIDSDHDKAKL